VNESWRDTRVICWLAEEGDFFVIHVDCGWVRQWRNIMSRAVV
jgi:hypothetical protein